MKEYKDYFTKWLEGKPGEFKLLQTMYDRAEAGFESRFEDDCTIEEALDKYFNNNLKKIEKEWDTYQQDDELKKMAHLTKGHILLRKGQYQGERFLNPQDCYQQACIVLRQGYDPEQTDFLNLLIQLTLGKYFCATAKHNQRSDYRRALDEFIDVGKKIEDSRQDKFSYWDTHIWLDARVYTGIAERYLYHLKKAKICFLDIIALLFKKSGSELYCDKQIRDSDNKVFINESLNKYLDLLNIQEDLQGRLGGNIILYKGYLIEALVQLGIAYQKSRDYQIAQDICVTILKLDKDNVDTANNLSVCLRKQGIKTSLLEHGGKEDKRYSIRNEDSEFFRKSYWEIFEMLDARGNRFAKLHDIKCTMYGDKKESENESEKISKRIEDLLKKNPADQEVRLLQGLYFQEREKFKKSQEILEALYQEAPHIAKGTIGLKAYYNIADNLLRLGNFREAIKYYERIQEECVKSADLGENEKLSGTMQDMWLEDLPTGDLLAKINEGWCLMNLGDYEQARKCYETIKEQYKAMPHRLRCENLMKIYNNLAECLLHLAKESPDFLNQAEKALMLVFEREPYNSTVNRHLGYYHKLNSFLVPWRKSEVNEALAHFETAELYNNDDVYVNAGWVTVAINPLLNNMDLFPSEKQGLIQKVENKLKYSSGTYSIKACSKLASFVKILEDGCRNNCYSPEKLKTMYRSLARVRLYEKEEGYNQFRHFMENDVFRRLKATKRGELLVSLFYLYDQIMQIKEICRFVPGTDKSGLGYSIPVHYTSLNTLKKLLSDTSDNPGRLRLWNTVYMNDSFEGEAFMEMMEQVEKERLGLDRQDGAVRDKMKKYFLHLDKQNVKGEVLTPVNENVYVISFSTQKDNIYMWVPYADDAKGCSLTFDADFFDIRKYGDDLTDVSCYSDSDYPLYQIQYLDEESLEQWKNGKEKEIVFEKDKKMIKILTVMEEIWKTIQDLEARIDGNGVLKLKWNTSENNQKETDLIHNFVTGCLNEVRFLFKSSEYAHEAEVRMFHYSYEPKVDMENFSVPRLYVEVDREIHVKEVQLGSKISESQANEIVSWLTKTNVVERITKSERHYK